MSIRNIIALVLTVISFVLLYFGLFEPLLTISIGGEFPFVGKVELMNETRSILKTIEDLYANDNAFVGFLILFFSVMIPVIKGIISLVVLIRGGKGYMMYRLVYQIGKWSMADVFVVGVFIAWLATKSEKFVNAELHDGFYYFLAYCIVSLIGIQLMKVEAPKKELF